MPKAPAIEHGRAQASYSPSLDIVSMPSKGSLKGEEYCKEDLIAELGAAFICGYTGDRGGDPEQQRGLCSHPARKTIRR